MISLKQHKHWLQAASVSLGLLAACSLYAAEDAKTPADAKGGNMESMEGMGQMSEMGNDGKGLEANKPMCKEHMKGMMHDEHESIADELKLDDKQQNLFKAAMKQMREGMHGGMELHKKLKAEVESDKYDEKNVREILRKHNAEMEEQMVASTRAMHEFYQSLGPWQKEKFKAIKDDMHGKMKERMMDRMREHKGDDHEHSHKQPLSTT
ncbi:MAG TPA: Spy/CpxP family protein refolding chaperone [Pseudomonadales bacterium]|nr:Spy/CpxP family protein refolding chaperone [Pseudomonadales bacterium]